MKNVKGDGDGLDRRSAEGGKGKGGTKGGGIGGKCLLKPRKGECGNAEKDGGAAVGCFGSGDGGRRQSFEGNAPVGVGFLKYLWGGVGQELGELLEVLV